MLPGTHLALAFPILLVCPSSLISLPSGAGFLLGSILPDKLDFFFSGGNFTTWSRIHRTWTHTWWIILLLFFSLFFVRASGTLSDLLLPFGKGVFLGAFYHVFWDMFTPSGIPVVNPMGRKFALPLLTSRGFKATMLCLCACLLSLFLLYRRIIANQEYTAWINSFSTRCAEIFPNIQKYILSFFQ